MARINGNRNPYEFSDTLQGTGQIDLIQGYGGSDTIHGGDGSDELYGNFSLDPVHYRAWTTDANVNSFNSNDGADQIFGDAGDDVIYGGVGNDFIDGGTGFDSAHFSGARSSYTLLAMEGPQVQVTGPDGVDTLVNVEQLAFSDMTVALQDDFSDSLADTSSPKGSLVVNGTATGTLELRGDHDWFSVQLISGHSYVINLRGSPSGGGTLGDAFLRLHNSAGTLLASDDDAGVGRDSQLAVRVSATGTFYINAGAFADFDAGTYTVEISDSGTAGRFTAPTIELANFAPGAGGWSSDDLYPRELADVNGGGIADIVGFGQAGVYVSLATGNGHFAAPTIELGNFAPGAGGWSSDNLYPRELADVNGDGLADIVGFGHAGVQVSLATGNGHFAAATFELAAFGPGAGGWSSDDLYHRELADVNGDGMADIVGFGQAGVYVSLATGNGHFAAQTFELANFAPGAGGWSSDDLYHRELADVNGDGQADIVGFGQAGVYVSLATGNGHFAAQTFELANFAPGAGGWSSDDLYHRELADVNGDGMADIVGFGQAGVYVSLATGNGHFAAQTFELANFAPGAGGWSSDDLYHRDLADVNGDRTADIVGFGQAGVYVSEAHNFLLI